MNCRQSQRQIGKSGRSASAIGLGTWAIGGWMWGGTDEKESVRAIEISIEREVSDGAHETNHATRLPGRVENLADGIGSGPQLRRQRLVNDDDWFARHVVGRREPTTGS